MADNSSGNSEKGVGFFGLLMLLFIGLKLTGYITWSWWWVLAPIWIAPAAIVGLGLAFLIIAGLGFGLYKLGELAFKPIIERRRIAQRQKRIMQRQKAAQDRVSVAQELRTNAMGFEDVRGFEDKSIDADFKIIKKDRS